MAPDMFGWIFIGTIGVTLLMLAIREDLLRRAGK